MDRTTSNKFGEGELFTIDDLLGSVYFECAACMSLYAEALSWANAHPDRIALDPEYADNIVVLSCQVTDLAVLNDLRRIERLYERFELQSRPRRFFICGCLARRFDIELPGWCRRLDHVREDYTFIEDKSLVTYAPPFWVEDFKEEPEYNDGPHRLRYQYPLRIGAGCSNNCTYCTIRTTRGRPYRLDHERVLQEFNCIPKDQDILLVADSPKPSQIKFWSHIAIVRGRAISIRNVEPWVALQCWDALMELRMHGRLATLHVPIQSVNPETLREMGRDPDATLHFIARSQLLRVTYGRIEPESIGAPRLVTNIIKQYDDHQDDVACVERLFDDVAWNPMWDGVWDRTKAEIKFKYHFPWHE